jgi:tRNA-dihydrouridine synthase
MEGFSDTPFRSICREQGSAMSYTEFINALDVIQGNPHVLKKLTFLSAERPVVFQIFDNEPARLLEAALRLQEFGPDIIDVNMGCSVRRVSGRGAGAQLLSYCSHNRGKWWRADRSSRAHESTRVQRSGGLGCD